MNERQLSLESRLLQLQDEIKRLESSALPPAQLKAKLQALCAERAQLEDALINLVVDPKNDVLSEAWSGFREGLLAAVQSLEQTLRGTVPATGAAGAPATEQAPASEGWLKGLLRRVAARPAVAWGTALVFVYLLLVAVSALGNGFSALFGGPQAAKDLFAFATNPFMGLLMGMLATAVIQSSSTTTSVIVALCAAGLPISTAVPMIMGANIGTSVTNTLVSLGHISHRREFRRAFAAATVHDFFNILAVVLFLPTEMAFGWLEKLSGWLAGPLYGSSGFNLKSLNFIAPLTKPVEHALHALFRLLPGPHWVAEGTYVLAGLVLIFCAILLLGTLLRYLLTGRAERIFRAAVGLNPLAAIGSGLMITVLVQSSSTTTSLVVPLAGAGLMRLKRVFPFTLGANIGTCVTALLASMAITGTGALYGLQIALIHLLFNLVGVLIIFGLPFLRRIPLACAASLAKVACERRSLAIVYIIGTFFILPLICLGIYRLVA